MVGNLYITAVDVADADTYTCEAHFANDAVLTAASTLHVISELIYLSLLYVLLLSDTCFTRVNHLSGKPGNLGEFDSCQGNGSKKNLIREYKLSKQARTMHDKLKPRRLHTMQNVYESN